MRMDDKVKETIGDVYFPTCRNEKNIFISTKKTSSFYDGKKRKVCRHVLNILYREQKPTTMLFGGDRTNCFATQTSGDYKKTKPSPFLKNFFSHSQSSTTETEPKRQKPLGLWHNRVDSPLVDIANQKFILLLFLFNFSLQNTNMISSASNDGSEWFPDFGPDSVTLTVKDLVQELTKSLQEIPLKLVDVPKKRFFEQPFSENFSYSRPGRDYGDEGRNTFKCRCTIYGHKRVSSV